MKILYVVAGIIVVWFLAAQISKANLRRKARPLAEALGGKLVNPTFPIVGADLTMHDDSGGQRICKIYWNQNGLVYLHTKNPRAFEVIRVAEIAGVGFDQHNRILGIALVERNGVRGWQFGLGRTGAASVGGVVRLLRELLKNKFSMTADATMTRLEKVAGPISYRRR